jgi:hypothetical protein
MLKWWKKVLQKKYLSHNRIRRLVDPLPKSKVSPIWHLCKDSTPLIQTHISWVYGNDKTVSL